KITTVQDDGVLDSGWYRLGCSLGILDTYQAADVEVVEASVWWTGWTTISLTVLIRDKA
ncbi:140_t:CDS:1, partial [Paraglomus occultum]